MKKGLIRKGLVYSIIVLFIGVGIQPALSVETKTSIVNKESEDCIECQEIDRISLLRAKILLFRVKVVTNIILSSKLGEIPEIKEKYQDIRNDIDSIESQDAPLICIMIVSMFIPYVLASWTLDFLVVTLAEQGLDTLADYFNNILINVVGPPLDNLIALIEQYECFEFPNP